MTYRSSLVALLVFLLPGAASARLAPSSFTKLVKESELIIEAAPIRVERTGMSAGQATLRVLRVLRGKYAKPEITIRWGDEVHDQQIPSIELDRLLFLKRGKDGYTGTHYGRSYWPFTSRVFDPRKADLDSASRGFLYTYPLSMVKLTRRQRSALLQPEKETPGGKKAPFISMSKLKPYLRGRQK